jgi:hypothetical protein
LKQKKLPVLRDIQYGPLLLFNSTVSYTYNHCVVDYRTTGIFIITCSFTVFVENCMLLSKGINEFVVFLCIVHVWFWFFYLQPLRSWLPNDRDIRLLIKFLTVYTCITFYFFALALGEKGVFYSYKKISMLHSFTVFVENCILLPKGINEFVVFLCIVHVWSWFFTLLPRFLLLVIKGPNGVYVYHILFLCISIRGKGCILLL